MWYFEPVWKFREKGMDGNTPPSGGSSSPPSGGGHSSTPPSPNPKPKVWRVERRVTGRGTPHATAYTRHVSPDGRVGMDVLHAQTPEGHEHIINLMHAPSSGPMSVETQLHIRPDGTTTVRRQVGGESVSVTPASEQLRQMASSFHKNDAWMPLLDKIHDEYPNQFHAAVQAHTTARTRFPGPLKPLRPRRMFPPPAQPPRPTA